MCTSVYRNNTGLLKVTLVHYYGKLFHVHKESINSLLFCGTVEPRYNAGRGRKNFEEEEF